MLENVTLAALEPKVVEAICVYVLAAGITLPPLPLHEHYELYGKQHIQLALIF
jgi:hypothetical protein